MGFEQFAGDEMNTDEERARAHSARLLLGPNGKSLFFRWMHHICKSVTMDTECGDRLPSPLALPDKTTLRQALSTVTLYHGLANPSRLTMRKLSRFFTEV